MTFDFGLSTDMRLGLFGGTFDPVHYGHLLLAEQCREQCALDEVWFLPSGSPPHKQDARITDGKHRTEMLKLATAGHPAFVVNDLELHRSGPTFTVETLRDMRERYPERELFFLIGADSLHDLPTWRAPAEILNLATLVAVNRGDRPLPEVQPLLDRIGEIPATRIQLITMPGIDLTATDLRRRVAAGKSIRFMTPRAVEMYIEQHGLFTTNPA